jgi:hypothetical protein
MGSCFFKQTEGSAALGELEDGRIWVIEIAKKAGFPRTGLHTCGDIIICPKLPLFGFSSDPGFVQAMDAECTFLDDALITDCRPFQISLRFNAVWAQVVPHVLIPGWLIPIKIANSIRTGYSAETTANTAGIILADDPFFILVGSGNRAYFDTWRIITMHTRAGKELGLTAGNGALSLRPHRENVIPENGTTQFCFRWGDNRGVILKAAGDAASLTGDAFIQVDNH